MILVESLSALERSIGVTGISPKLARAPPPNGEKTKGLAPYTRTQDLHPYEAHETEIQWAALGRIEARATSERLRGIRPTWTDSLRVSAKFSTKAHVNSGNRIPPSCITHPKNTAGSFNYGSDLRLRFSWSAMGMACTRAPKVLSGPVSAFPLCRWANGEPRIG